MQTGGTLHECRLGLKAAGAKNISASVVHAVFPNRSFLEFAEGGSREGFQTFYVTDSVPEVANVLAELKPFRVLSIAASIKKEFESTYFS